MIDMTVKWYMGLDSEEIDALVEYHRNMQYEAARKEDYNEAAHYKSKAEHWAALKGKTLKVVEEA